MNLSIIVPCYNEESNVEPLYQAILDVIGDNEDYQIVFVDDGSKDNTLKRIKTLREKDHRVRYMSFQTNYGHQIALIAGLRSCTSDLLITMDADLQHPPSYIPLMIEKYKTTGAEVVVGRRKEPQKGFFKNFFSKFFYMTFSMFTNLRLIPGVSDFCLYSRRAADVICDIREREPFLRGIIQNLRFKVAVIDYDLGSRNSGQAVYSFSKSMRMALNAFIRYSSFYINFAFFLAAMGIILSIAMAAQYIYQKIFSETLPPGQADLMVFLSFISSLILFILAIICKYLLQIQDYLRQQPIYLIAEMELGE